MDDERESEIEAVNARLGAFQRTGDPRHLWPTVDERSRLAALGDIERVVTAVLRHDGTPSLDGVPDALGVAACTSGTGPLLGVWAERGWIDVGAEVGAVLANHLAHARARAVRLEAGLARALDLLAARGLVPTVLKGFHTARRYYPEPGARPMHDIDLWFDPMQRHEAERALADAGWAGGDTQRRPYKRDWYAPAVDRRVRALAFSHAWDPWRIEMHASLDRVFAPGRIARFPRRAGDDEPWTVAGRPVRVLAPPLLVAQLAAHASEETHTTRLLRLIELVLIVRQEAAFDWAHFRALVRSTRTASFVYPALAMAERLAPSTIDPATLAECSAAAGARVRRFVARGTPADRVGLQRVSLAEKFLWSRGPVGIVRRAGLLLWPKAGGSLGAVLRTYARRVYRLTHRH